MNWADAMKDTAERSPTGAVATEAAATFREAPSAWEPHDVWLNRIKLPRDLAALRQAEAPAGQ
jgi:hypothetical protein